MEDDVTVTRLILSLVIGVIAIIVGATIELARREHASERAMLAEALNVPRKERRR